MKQINIAQQCVCLVMYYLIHVYTVAESTPRFHVAQTLEASLQGKDTWDPTTKYDIEAIQKWHTSRQQIMMNLMERQRQMDLQKAETARKIAEMRAKKLLLRVEAQQLFHEKRGKSNTMLKDKGHFAITNDITPVDDTDRTNNIMHRATGFVNTTILPIVPAGNTVRSDNIGPTDISVSADNIVLLGSIGVATNNKAPVDKMNPISNTERVDNSILFDNISIPTTKSVQGNNNTNNVAPAVVSVHNITPPSTSSVPDPTAPSTSRVPNTTAPATSSVPNTTTPTITGLPNTTVPTSSRAQNNFEPATSKVPNTIAASSSRIPNTTEQISSNVQNTTSRASNNIETSTSNIPSSTASSTSSVPNIVARTTIHASNKLIQTTSKVPNTSASSTNSIPKTTEPINSSVPNTNAPVIGTVPDAIASTLSTVPDATVSTLSTVPDAIASTLSTVPDATVSTLSTVPDAIASTLSTVPDATTSTSSSVPNTTVQTTSSVPNTDAPIFSSFPNNIAPSATSVPATTSVPNSKTPDATSALNIIAPVARLVSNDTILPVNTSNGVHIDENLPVVNNEGDASTILIDTIFREGILAQPMDVGLNELERDHTSRGDIDILDKAAILLGPQTHTKDVVLRPKMNTLKDHKIDKMPVTAQMGGANNKTSDSPVNQTTLSGSNNSSLEINETINGSVLTLRDILSLLNVSDGMDPKLTTSNILEDKRLRTILANAVQNISRLLSLENPVKTTHRVDVFHHVHMHTHDPHGANDMVNDMPKSTHSSRQAGLEPGFVVNDLPILDLTKSSLSEGDHLKRFIDIENNINTKPSTNAIDLSSGIPSVNTDNIQEGHFESVWNEPHATGPHGIVESREGGGIPADKPRHVDIINRVDDESLHKGSVIHNNNKNEGRTIVITTTSSSDILNNRPSVGIRTIHGELMPMPQVSNSKPEGTVRSLSVHSFLAAIRDRLKGKQ